MMTSKLKQTDPLFWKRVKIQANGCWLFLGARQEEGYGVIKRRGRQEGAHRYAWRLVHKKHLGRWDFICHHCDNPSCVNPDHLFLGSPQDNYDDMRTKNRDRKAHGRNHYMTSLIENDIPIIRSRYDQGESPKRIGNDYKISRQTVYDIGRRRTWKHVPERTQMKIAA